MNEQGQMMTKQIAREQLQLWRNMMHLRPDDTDVMQNVASCLFTLGDSDESVKLYESAYALNTGSSGIAMNYGMVLKDMAKFGRSGEVVHHAFSIDPDFFYLRLGWAESLLRNGNWRDAWPLYQEARPATKQGARNTYQIPDGVPEWQGEALIAPNNRLIVLGEGGTGDRITYSRWLPELTKRGIQWVYAPDNIPPIPGALPLFCRVPWLKDRVPTSQPFEYTHWTTVFSLPACFDAIPTAIPEYPSWFLPNPDLVGRYRFKFDDGKPVYGLIWGANELFEGGMKFRSIKDSQIMRLVLETRDLCHWINCWAGDAHGNEYALGKPVINPIFTTWDETAALLSNMDAVVTTDNGAGWLAQALGKPTSLLLSGNSDWKFLRGTAKSYWHKRTRLFRNDGQGFDNAIDKLIAAIQNGEGVGRCV